MQKISKSNQGISLFIFCLVFACFQACSESPYMQGKRLYTANCQNCHMNDGSGLANLIPPLNSSIKLGTNEMICVIINGIQDTIRKDSTFLVKEMPSYKNLSATEISNIVNYVNHTWHKDFKEKTILEIESAILSCK